MYHRILVTGANGMLGQSLLKQLSTINDFELLATARQPKSYLPELNLEYAPLDLCDAEATRKLFKAFSPNIVINTAAMTQVDECETERIKCWQTNVEVVETLVSCCKSNGGKLIQLSTDFIFDGKRGPYTEKARPNPLSFYGRSKLASENILRGLPRDQWAIVRTVLVYGTGIQLSRSNFALWTLEKLRKGESLNMVTNHFRTPTFVDDLADGILRIIKRKKRGIWHISGSEYQSVYDIAKQVALAAHLNPNLIHPTTSDAFPSAARRPEKSGFVILKAQTELGYQPHSLADGIKTLL